MKCELEAFCTKPRPPSDRMATNTPSKLPPTPYTLPLAPLAPVGLPVGRPNGGLVRLVVSQTSAIFHRLWFLSQGPDVALTEGRLHLWPTRTRYDRRGDRGGL